MNYKKGFTLLEILIVVGIIAAITAFGAAAYGSAQKKARDAKRKGDLGTIQKAYEEYYSICGYQYPTTMTSVICTTPNPTVAILPTVPVDPRTTTPYPLTPAAGTAYTICTTLESESPSSYCVSNRQ